MQLIGFLSGVSARILGLIGLSAAGLLVFMAQQSGTENLQSLAFYGAGGLFCLVKGLQFLVPSSFNTTLLQATNALPRAAFLLVTFAWLLVCGFVILEFGRQTEVTPAIARALLCLVGAGMVLFVVFILSGLSFSLATSKQTQDPFEPVVEYHSAEPLRSVFTQDTPPPRYLSQHYAAALAGAPLLRARDIWDYLAILLLVIAVIGGLAAFRLSPTVQTTALNDLIAQNLIPVYVAVTMIFAAPIVIVSGLRAPPTGGMEAMGPVRKLTFLLAAAPLFGALMTLIVPFDLAPTVWNLATENPVETVRYEIAGREQSGPLARCLELRPINAEARGMTACGLDATLVSDLRVGMTIAATGELSPYAHTLSLVEIVP